MQHPTLVTAGAGKEPAELRDQRRRRSQGCLNHLIVAPLWVAYEANLGTLLRRCDAVGACMAVPPTAHYRDALRRGDTLARRPCLHWADRKVSWIALQKDARARILGVELADDATRLVELGPARQRTVVLLWPRALRNTRRGMGSPGRSRGDTDDRSRRQPQCRRLGVVLIRPARYRRGSRSRPGLKRFGCRAGRRGRGPSPRSGCP